MFIPLSDLKTALATVSADFCSTIFCPFDSFVVMSNFDSILNVQDKFSVAEILDDCGRCCVMEAAVVSASLTLNSSSDCII